MTPYGHQNVVLGGGGGGGVGNDSLDTGKGLELGVHPNNLAY